MLGQMRASWARYFAIGIVLLIAVLFAVEGVVFNRATRGMQEGAVAGIINGDRISLGEFNRAYERTVEFYRGMLSGGGAGKQAPSLSEEQLKMFRVRESTFNELVKARLMAQAGRDQGLAGSDAQVRAEIQKIPSFQKDGHFDRLQYEQVLQANGYSSSKFEEMVRDEISAQEWQRSLQTSVRVTDAEIRNAFLEKNTLRKIRYVAYLKTQSGLKGDANATAAKIASWLQKNKSSEQSVKAFETMFKAENLRLDQTGLVSRSQLYVPHLSESTPWVLDLFEKSGDSWKAAGPKVYEVGDRVVIYQIVEAKDPVELDFEKQKTELKGMLKVRKAQSLLEAETESLMEKADIDPNPTVVGEWVKPDRSKKTRL